MLQMNHQQPKNHHKVFHWVFNHICKNRRHTSLEYYRSIAQPIRHSIERKISTETCKSNFLINFLVQLKSCCIRNTHLKSHTIQASQVYKAFLSHPEPTPWAGLTLENHSRPQANPWYGLLTQWKTSVIKYNLYKT